MNAIVYIKGYMGGLITDWRHFGSFNFHKSATCINIKYYKGIIDFC
jgi:hypothetical protein